MTIVTPPPAIDRDRYGRPMVVPPKGGKRVPYTRATTYIDVLDDKFNLQRWMQRMVALGLASRPDLLLSVSAHRDDKEELNAICEKAREAAAASAAATTGTALHALTELIDRGEELPAGLPAGVKASLDCYIETTAPLRSVLIEQFMVLDSLRIGGTPDRVVEFERKRYIGDIKTGDITWSILKIAMQLAVYARSRTYNIATAERQMHGADLEQALVIHLPAVEDPAEARCDLYRVDILEGWNAVMVARDVRQRRKLKFDDLTRPFDDMAGFKATLEALRPARVEATPTLADRIKACPSADDVRSLWAAYASEWTDDLTEVARKHIADLPSVS